MIFNEYEYDPSAMPETNPTEVMTMSMPGDDDDANDEDGDWSDIDDEDFEDLAEDRDDFHEMEIENDLFDEDDADHLPDDDME